MIIRIGHAYDVHRLVTNRRLVLGGILIPFELGLLGHSDADVALHVVAESILGALALGDLGTHFPDNDQKNKDIDSKTIVLYAVKLMKEKQFSLSNIDITLFAEAPKLNPYIDCMRENIALMLNVSIDQVSVKATTHEKLGAIGRQEGIAAEAVVCIQKFSQEVLL